MQANKDKVFIKQLPPETHTASGLLIPDNVQRNQAYGIVFSVGPYDKALYGEIQAGDKVGFSKYAGEPVYIERDDYLVMHPGVIMTIIKDGKYIPVGSVLIVEIESKYKKTEKVGNLELVLDVPKVVNNEEVFFNKRNRIEPKGRVIGIPTINPIDLENNTIDPIIQDGDEIYFRYMNIADETGYLEKSVTDFSEKRIIRVPYHDVFAIVRDDKIITVGDWVLGDKYIEGDGEEMDMGVTTIKVKYTASGLVESVNTKPSVNKAIVQHCNSDALKPGDVIFSKIGINFENEINGKNYYCFREGFQVDAVIGRNCDKCKNNCPCKK
jgi:chaperonin GroES